MRTSVDSSDTIDHECLVRLIELRVADRRVVRLIRKWLNAGVLVTGEWRRSEVGTPQGGGISPLLANIYLHYVFDLWIRDWRRQAHGDVIVVRYADDFIVAFESEQEARRFRAELGERLAQYGLELHPDKTRLIEFGARTATDATRRGGASPRRSTSSVSRTSAGRRETDDSRSCGGRLGRGCERS